MEVINLNPLVKKVSCKEHIIDPVVKFKYSTEKGDGFLGVIKAIEIHGKNKSLEVIVKYAADSDNLRKQAPIREAFLTEMWFYDKIIPEQVNLQIEYSITNPFVNYPKCYGISKNNKQEILFLENLKQHGYCLWNRKKPMNHEHLKFVFNEYGRYHGTNFAIKHLKPSVYKEITSGLVDMIELFNRTEGFSGLVMTLAAKIKDVFDPIKEKDYYETTKAFAERSMEYMRETAKIDEFSSILHGDCWCNNMMFKYDAENSESRAKPSDMRLLDFQISKIGPLVLDLSYFFYASASKEALDNLDNHLKSYHKNLGCYLKQYGIDVNEVYTFENFKAEWKKYCKFGLTMAIFLRKIMLADADEVPDMSEAAEKDGDMLNEFSFESKHENEYKRQIKELVAHFVQREFI